MQAEVAVLYGDLDIVRVPWNEKQSLQRDQVLAVAVIRPGVIRQCSILHDYYQLIWTETEFCLTGHDGDYGFYGADGVDWRFPFVLPDNCIEFDGVYVNNDDWQKALLIYADPNGGMV